jgi:hypothetical protein
MPVYPGALNIQLDVGHLGEVHRRYNIYVKPIKEIDLHPQPLSQEWRAK